METNNKPSPTPSSHSGSNSAYNSKSLTTPHRSKNTNNVPNLLLLAMFAIAARYRTEPEVPLPLNEGDMWNAGDEYLEDAKILLSKTIFSVKKPVSLFIFL